MLPSLYGGFAWTIQSVITMLFFPSLHSFSEYDFVNVILLLSGGVFCLLGQTLMSLANKHSLASKMAPFTNLEIVFTIFVDIFLFGYKFVNSDIMGMAVILVCILTPVGIKVWQSYVPQEEKTLL